MTLDTIVWRTHQSWKTKILTAVRKDLMDKHTEYCLCYICDRFKPGSKKNCKIAQATYNHDIKYNIVTPMWECPSYRI